MKIAARIKELQPEASNRQIAKVMGVDPQTINNDVAEFSARDKKKSKENKDGNHGGAENSAPATLSGAAAARSVEARETKVERQAARVETRSQRELESLGSTRTPKIDGTSATH
jgi:hypothetical protein